MRIGIDTFGCDSGESGIGVYLKYLLRYLPRGTARYELFGWEFDRYVFSDVAEDLEFISQSFSTGRTANSLWHIFRYPEFARQRGYEVCFFPAANRCLPWKSPCPTVGTVHDLGAYRGPLRNREHLGAVLRVVFPDSIRHLDRIIAVSEWVKQELIEVARVKPHRVVVIPNGIDTSAFYPRPKNEESVLLIQPFSFKRPYILYVSRIEYPLKNHVRLIQAFEIFKERTHFPHRLVLAGADRKGADKVKRVALQSRYRQDIFFTGYFPYKHLPELYAGADMVVFPSLYEGFGLGVLEAMACGVPVACARAASLPETAEHGALYFNPYSPEDMADRMVTLATDRSIHRECRQRGLERAQQFSWERCAQETFKVLMEAAGR
ncbi:MAG: glycosyltransferase family 4 protein [Treponemataceae bacterium]|nr:glycosyltransferase family 4 protein [Treponemataceae bacterium]